MPNCLQLLRTAHGGDTWTGQHSSAVSWSSEGTTAHPQLRALLGGTAMCSEGGIPLEIQLDFVLLISTL